MFSKVCELLQSQGLMETRLSFIHIKKAIIKICIVINGSMKVTWFNFIISKYRINYLIY